MSFIAGGLLTSLWIFSSSLLAPHSPVPQRYPDTCTSAQLVSPDKSECSRHYCWSSSSDLMGNSEYLTLAAVMVQMCFVSLWNYDSLNFWSGIQLFTKVKLPSFMKNLRIRTEAHEREKSYQTGSERVPWWSRTDVFVSGAGTGPPLASHIDRLQLLHPCSTQTQTHTPSGKH